MIKTLSFALMHFSVAFGVVWLMTGDALIGGAVALVEPAINTVAYHFHERGWERWRARRQPSAVSGMGPAGWATAAG